MALSAIPDKSSLPGSKELAEILGRTSALGHRLRDYLATEYPPVAEKWAMSSEKWGWSLQLRRKKRTILYMTPCKKLAAIKMAN